MVSPPRASLFFFFFSSFFVWLGYINSFLNPVIILLNTRPGRRRSRLSQSVDPVPQYEASRAAGKSISEVTNFLPSGTHILNSVEISLGVKI